MKKLWLALLQFKQRRKEGLNGRPMKGVVMARFAAHAIAGLTLAASAGVARADAWLDAQNGKLQARLAPYADNCGCGTLVPVVRVTWGGYRNASPAVQEDALIAAQAAATAAGIVCAKAGPLDKNSTYCKSLKGVSVEISFANKGTDKVAVSSATPNEIHCPTGNSSAPVTPAQFVGPISSFLPAK